MINASLANLARRTNSVLLPSESISQPFDDDAYCIHNHTFKNLNDRINQPPMPAFALLVEHLYGLDTVILANKMNRLGGLLIRLAHQAFACST